MIGNSLSHLQVLVCLISFPGFPFLEPSFAVVVRSKGDNVHGVLCRISKKDFIQILKTEGGGGTEADGYRPLVAFIPLMNSGSRCGQIFRTNSQGNGARLHSWF